MSQLEAVEEASRVTASYSKLIGIAAAREAEEADRQGARVAESRRQENQPDLPVLVDPAGLTGRGIWLAGLDERTGADMQLVRVIHISMGNLGKFGLIKTNNVLI